MVVFLLEQKEKLNTFDNRVIKWIKRNLRSENIDYKLIFLKPYITELELNLLDLSNNKIQYIFWSGNLTNKNLSIVKQFQNSIVMLSKQTIFSVNNNGFTENDAINHNLKIMYLDEEEQEYNKDWKLAIKSSYFNITQRIILESIYNNESNYKNSEIVNEEFEDNFENLTKIQYL